MNTPLNNDTQQKARDLARQITVAQDLDPEIQEELYGHIEDKLLAYKSGEERISDEDAFILVREHFGDAKVIRGLLQEVHAGAATLSLGRRIGAACIILLAVGWWCRLLALPLQGIARALVIDGEFSSQSGATAFLLYYAPMSLYPLGVAMAFLYFRRRVDLGSTLWFHRWRIRAFFQMGALLMVATYFTPAFEALPFHTITGELIGLDPGEVHTALAAWVLLCWLCVAWLWWCDVSLRRPAGALYCLATWMAMAMLARHLPVQFVLIAADDPGTAANPSGQIVLFGVFYTWTVKHAAWAAIMDNLSWDLRIVPLVGMSSLLLYSLRSHLHVLMKTNAEYPRPITGLQVTGICFFFAMTLWALFRDQPWTMPVTVSLLVALVSLPIYAAINLVYISRANASGLPCRARALRHTANGLLCLTFLFSLYHHLPNSTADGIQRAVFLAGTMAAIACIAVAALLNWWKSSASIQGRDVLVRK